MRLKGPLLELAVVLPDAAVEVPRHARDGVFVADVGLAQSARTQPAQALGGFDQQYRFALHFGGVSRDDTRRRAAIDADVVGFLGEDGGGD